MSIICPNCNKTLNDNAKFCHYCGGKISGSATVPPKSTIQNGGSVSGYSQKHTYVHSNQGTPVPQELADQVVDPGEKMIACLKDSAAKTFVTGNGIGTNKIFFTNKRFYAKTNQFSLRSGIFTNNFVVDLADISGTQILHRNPIGSLLGACLFLILGFIASAISSQPAMIGIGIVVAIICGINFFIKRGTYLQISYPGNFMDLSVKMYRYNTVMEFQKKLRATISK